ncbi:MAG: FtsX-like permease family protein [Flavobacteriaceae bacterium]
MQVPFFIALRYFFTRSKQSIINLINLISIGVVLVATASLFIVLSAFSGLKDFGLSFSNSFDPSVRVSASYGKVLQVDSLQLEAINALDEVVLASPVLEEKVFLSFNNKNQVALLKGVGNRYPEVVQIDSLIVSGNWFKNDFDEVVIGGGIANNLSLGVYDYTSFLTLSAPKRKGGVGLGKNPFTKETALVSGIYFASEQLDKKYLFARLELARRLLQRSQGEYTYLEIKTAKNHNLDALKASLKEILSQNISVLNRAQLNAALYKMLNTENLAVYLIFSLIIIIALFNVVGALIMMFLDKKPQLKILYTMGLRPKEIQRVFFYLGGLICWVGGGLGVLTGVLLVLIQDYLPLLYVPGTSLPYPVLFELKNFLIVLFTILILGTLTTAWATRNMDKKVGVL